MLSPHQFYRRVAFGINDDESKSNPLASAVSQLSNLKTVKWSHFHPTPIDAIKFLNFIKLTSKKIKKEQGGGQNEVDSYFKEKNIDHDNFRAELAFRAHNAIHGPSPVLDRFHFFWTNHFPVHGKKVGAPVGPYYRKIIRESLNGSFSNLVKNVMTSSSMMRYLDNVDSVGPNSTRAKTHAHQNLGLNENLGRELLELYTVSPSAAYSQEDVVNTALILTGWGGDRSWAKNNFPGLGEMYAPIVFRADTHEGGNQKVLGKIYSGGKKKLFNLIDDLCEMDHCVEFISRKLAIHFISDSPSNEAVEHIKSAYKSSKGNLLKLHQATLEAVWKYAEPNQKINWPEVWLIQAMKTLNIRAYPLDPKNGDNNPIDYKKYATILDKLGNNPFEHGQPNGYSSFSNDWISPELIDRRIIISMFLQNIFNQSKSKNNLLDSVTNFIPESKALKQIAASKMDGNIITKILCHSDFIRT